MILTVQFVHKLEVPKPSQLILSYHIVHIVTSSCKPLPQKDLARKEDLSSVPTGRTARLSQQQRQMPTATQAGS